MKRLLILLLPTILFAAPAQVILIRHAENSDSKHSLALKGRERATAFVPFFKSAPTVNSFSLPTAIFVPSDSAESLQTIQPLAENIHVPITKTFGSNQTALLADEILKNPDHEGHMLLVCADYEQLPQLAKKLGAKKAPKSWDNENFDRLWILTFNDKGEVTFADVPQKLLFNDSK